MTRTRLTIVGGTLLVAAAVVAGVSLARGQGTPSPLPPSRGAGYSDISAALPDSAWPALPGRLRGPAQPILYRHDIHAGQYRIPCLYCHNNAANSWTANIPTVASCMGCHLVISAADSAGNPDAEIQKLRDHWNDGRSIPWVRVYKISEHAHFPHMRHVNARIACQECHGNVQQMPQVFAYRDVNNMGWCTDCHMRRGVTRDCTACHF
jgi:hypothetical protein